MVKKSNYKIFLLMMIFIVPVIMSGIVFHYHNYFKFKTMNHGILINPPIAMSGLNDEKKWRIVYVVSGNCDNQCQKIDFQLHQVRKALGKDRDRVSVMQVQPQKTLTGNKIYLVDPNNIVFMYYPDDTNPMNILKDLKRALEVSQIG